MNKAYISFSFDDGRIDNYTIVYPLLKKYNLPATFNITTAYVEGKINKETLTYANPMDVEMVKKINDDSMMEIAGHGYWHRNTIDDIVHGVRILRKDLEINPVGGGKRFCKPRDRSEYGLLSCA